MRHLKSGDTERPDVRLEVVLVLADDLGRHPEGRADEGAALGHGGRELAGDTEVGELDLVGVRVRVRGRGVGCRV